MQSTVESSLVSLCRGELSLVSLCRGELSLVSLCPWHLTFLLLSNCSPYSLIFFIFQIVTSDNFDVWVNFYIWKPTSSFSTTGTYIRYAHERLAKRGEKFALTSIPVCSKQFSVWDDTVQKSIIYKGKICFNESFSIEYQKIFNHSQRFHDYLF
jgi:hypothetical protein